jgi:hypothetical protein
MMKRLFNLLLVLTFVGLFNTVYVSAQIYTHEQGDPYMIEKIQEQLHPNLADFPC